ncbi:MAG: hypothetical protein U1U88_001381 [Lawsonella clevelandensis]
MPIIAARRLRRTPVHGHRLLTRSAPDGIADLTALITAHKTGRLVHRQGKRLNDHPAPAR